LLEQAGERGFYPHHYIAVHCPFLAALRSSRCELHRVRHLRGLCLHPLHSHPGISDAAEERVGVAQRPVDDGILRVEHEALLMRVKPLLRLSDEPLRGI
jgi:hypothetical protein